MNFDDAFKLVIGHEGAFTDDAKDTGNWTSGKIGIGKLNGTKYGISAAAYPSIDIKNITLEHAKEIYKRDYWLKYFCELVPSEARFSYFDALVNSGPGNKTRQGAIIWLQKALGVTADGIIGNKTLSALKGFNGSILAMKLNGYRLLFLTELKAWGVYGKGLTARVAKNLIGE
jgi:lysozyme family protein